MYSRREFGAATFAGLSLSMLPSSALWADTKTDATVNGVKLGAITGAYGPFNAQPGQDVVDLVIQRSRQYGVGHVELVNSLIEPPLTGPCKPPETPPALDPANIARRFPCGVGGQVPLTRPAGYEAARDELRRWRIKAPLDRFRSIRRKFNAAGIDLFSYVMTIGDDFTDAEIDAVYRHMQALGVNKFCTNQTRVSMAPRMVPHSDKYKIRAAFHPHAMSQDPNEIASPESLAKVLAMSEYFMVNLDIGWYYDGGSDPLAYFNAHPDRITHIHVRDRSAVGKQADIGTGILRIDQMLRTTRDKRHDIAFIVEQGGRTGTKDSGEAVQQNIQWMKSVLQS